MRQSFPTVYTLSDPYHNLPGGVSPFPFNYSPTSPRFTAPSQVFGPSLDFVWPVSYQTNVSVQKELFRNYSISASYVGAFGRHLAAPVDNNYPVLTSTATTANVNARRPYQPGVIGAANVLSSIFGSDYNGWQFSAERRGARLSGKAYYSIGRGYEDVDFQGGGLPTVQNATQLAAERGRNSNDRRQSFVLSAVWKIDYLKQSKSLLAKLAQNWTLSTIITLQTGTPLTITAGSDRNFDGLTNDRANLVGDPNLDHGRPQGDLIEGWFNTAAFALPAAGHERHRGPQHRGRSRATATSTSASTATSRSRVRASFSCAPRGRTSSTLVNLSNPGTNIAAPTTFGKIRSAGNMRRIQLGARFSF